MKMEVCHDTRQIYFGSFDFLLCGVCHLFPESQNRDRDFVLHIVACDLCVRSCRYGGKEPRVTNSATKAAPRVEPRGAFVFIVFIHYPQFVPIGTSLGYFQFYIQNLAFL